MLAEQAELLRRLSALLPQPIAAACGRIVRASSEESQIDAAIKAGEVLARYLACVGIASWVAREEGAERPPFSPEKVSGPLAFGAFLEVAEQIAVSSGDHPLRQPLAAAMVGKAKGRKQEAGAPSSGLRALVELRNELGHDISSLNRAKALAVLRDNDPIAHLLVALRKAHEVLNLPLFVLEDQQNTKGQILGCRLLLMGDSYDPCPEEIALSSALFSLREPYLGIGRGAICLSPLLDWNVAPVSANYQVFMIDAIEERRVKYRAVGSAPRVIEGDAAQRVRDYVTSDRVALESVQLADGRSFAAEWGARRKLIEQSLHEREGRIPWNDFDQETLKWFASRLDPERASDLPQAIIVDRLLDGREALDQRERDQLTILLGTRALVRRLVRRGMIDLRERGAGSDRWDERIEADANIFACLEQAIAFLARGVGIDAASLDGLQSKVGTADYIAMREALVNLFIHQDYSDPSASAQVELTPDRAVFFNPGRALVSSESLVEGGKSQARNPLIARALRLIGLAELAGSGLRELQRMWRVARRRPPRMDSNDSANTFALTLDWRPILEAYDAFWKDKIGVRLSESEALILNLALDASGVSSAEAASATGVLVDEAAEALKTLVRQALVEEEGGRFRAMAHLRELVVR